jgi:CRP-like cAMP-binding protein
MNSRFARHLLSVAAFTPAEIQQIEQLAVPKKLLRKEYVLREGEVNRHKIFVCSGLLRAYQLAPDGSEYIMRFAAEGAWMIDHESYSRQAPSRYFIQALEDAELLLLTKAHMDELIEFIPSLRYYSEQVREQSMNHSLQRILTNISYTAEEKYMSFVQSYPDVFNRVPLHMVASYLGVSRETLSRIRHAQAVGEKI